MREAKLVHVNIEVTEEDARSWVERKPANEKQIPPINEGSEEEACRFRQQGGGTGVNRALKILGFCKRKENIIGLREVLNWK